MDLFCTARAGLILSFPEGFILTGMKIHASFLLVILCLAIAACGGAPVNLPATDTVLVPTQTASQAAATATETSAPTQTETPVFTATITQTPTADTRPLPRSWGSWPIIPAASARVVQIYLDGLKKGNTPNTYSAVGDCQSMPDVFMGIYGTDRNPIGADSPDLLETIQAFKGSFKHDSAAVRDGLSAPSALDPLWADPKRCNSNESPVACELRLYKPAIMFVNLGTNWKAGASAEAYENYLRKIVDLIIANGTVPILTNKADNVEGDHSLNLATAKVAYDYDIPLINFWLAADKLPNHGLDENRDNIYLTPAGWDVRSNVALRTLDSIWRSLQAATP
jgi:hypothetical protein